MGGGGAPCLKGDLRIQLFKLKNPPHIQDLPPLTPILPPPKPKAQKYGVERPERQHRCVCK